MPSICCAANSGDQWSRPWNGYSQLSPSSQHVNSPIKIAAYPNNPQARYVNPTNQYITVYHGNRNPLNPSRPQQYYAPNYMQTQAHNQKYHIPSAPKKYPNAPAKYQNAPVKYPSGPIQYGNAMIQYSNGRTQYVNSPAKYSNGPTHNTNAPAKYLNGRTQYGTLPPKYPNGPVQSLNAPVKYPNSPIKHPNAYENSPVLKSTANPYLAAPQRQSHTAYRPYASVKAYVNQQSEDPVLRKVVNDVNANEIRLKKKEQVPKNHPSENEDDDEESHGNIHRNQEHENHVPQYENYYPELKPTYYKKPTKLPPNYSNLNKYAAYPRPNFENIRVHPDTFKHLKSRVSQLKKVQGNHFGNEKNEYPQNRPDDEDEDDEAEGQDIFDHQKKGFDNQNKNFNKNFQDFTDRHHPNVPPLQGSLDYSSDENSNDEVEFIPVKTYAQVRHVETTKHLPRESAYEDAVTHDDLVNAPRLREAIKTSKAQIVYSEEGYEDGAYDHAGHTKQASNHEGHGGFLKSKHDGSGLYKNSGDHSYDDGGKSQGGQDVSSGKTWSNDEGSSEDFDDQENFSKTNGKYADNDDDDLTEAGSEKRISPNTSYKPTRYFKGNQKLVMSGSVEKRYEDVAGADLDKKKEENETIKPKKHDTGQDYVGAHLRKALEFNYGPEVWNIDTRPKKNKDQYPMHSDVEVFSTDIKTEGPMHGGNYRHIDSVDQSPKSKKFSKRHNDWQGVSKNAKNPSKVITSSSFVADSLNAPSMLSVYQSDEDLVDLYGDTSDQPRRYSDKFLELPEEYSGVYKQEHETELSPQTTSLSEDPPVASEVEVLTSVIKGNKGPKHGGNYKKYSSAGHRKKKQEEASEVDDLNSSNDSSGGHLHGGNYRTAPEAELTGA